MATLKIIRRRTKGDRCAVLFQRPDQQYETILSRTITLPDGRVRHIAREIIAKTLGEVTRFSDEWIQSGVVEIGTLHG